MIEDLLKAVLSGAGSQSSAGQVESDPLVDLLGGIFGGGMSQTPQNIPSAGGFAGIANEIMGAGSSNSVTGSLVAPISNMLAEKLNLPPAIAQIVVTFVMGKLLSNAVGGVGASGRLGQSDLGLDELLANMDGGQGFDVDYLQSTGMVEALSRKTGLDHDTATESMQEVFKMLSGQQAAGSRPSQPRNRPEQEGDLDDLLDALKGSKIL
jgi:hypothetical protein